MGREEREELLSIFNKRIYKGLISYYFPLNILTKAVAIGLISCNLAAEASTLPPRNVRFDGIHIYVNNFKAPSLNLSSEMDVSFSREVVELNPFSDNYISLDSRNKASHESCKGNTEVFEYVKCRLSYDWYEMLLKLLVTFVLGFLGGIIYRSYKKDSV